MAARIVIKQREVNKLLKGDGVYATVAVVARSIDARASVHGLTRLDINTGSERVRAAVIAGYDSFGSNAMEQTRNILLGSL